MRASFIAVCTWLLIASGSFLTVCGVLDYWESHNAQSQIAEQWQPELPQTTVPKRPSPPPPNGATVAKLSIPRLDTTLYVVEGTSTRDLKRAPGHLTGTVLPGDDGNCVIAGHRDTHFRVLKDIQRGDEVLLERDGQTFRYRVNGTTIVTPDNTASLKPTTKAVLNLVTCYPFYYVGSAPKRFIVHADLEGLPLQASR